MKHPIAVIESPRPAAYVLPAFGPWMACCCLTSPAAQLYQSAYQRAVESARLHWLLGNQPRWN